MAREVIGERIRGKVATSKRKGIWMGGVLPLGYDVRERLLMVNHDEAKMVRHIIFDQYLELGCVRSLKSAEVGFLRTVHSSGQYRPE